MEDIKYLWNYKLIEFSNYSITLGGIIVVLGIYVAARILLLIIKYGLLRKFKKGKSDYGSRYAIYKIISYLVWFAVIVMSLETSGVKLTLLLAGSAALLVGVGLGLQQTFNDFMSGLILLVENSVRVGDVIEVEGKVVTVEHIGLRTSHVVDRDDIEIIIPNSIIVNNAMINWTRTKELTRFRIQVGVAYGSELEKVTKALEDAAIENEKCFKDRPPIARLMNFGDSSLDFELLFWSQNQFRIEQTKAEIRAAIVRNFKEAHITIPFPQRDLHIIDGLKKENKEVL